MGLPTYCTRVWLKYVSTSCSYTSFHVLLSVDDKFSKNLLFRMVAKGVSRIPWRKNIGNKKSSISIKNNNNNNNNNNNYNYSRHMN